MSAPAAYVHVDLDGVPHRVGRLWVRASKGRETATFEYDPEWLAAPSRYSLQPATMPVGPGPFHTAAGQSLFGPMGDSAPDRWGRTLLARAERMRALEEGRQRRTLREIDFLLGVSDFGRVGALRFTAEPDGPFLAEGGRHGVPPLVELPRLLSATDHVLDDSETAADLRLLLAPGSSLGGARPKASVLDRDGTLLIAKFPARSDAHDVVRWEAVALGLASRAGIEVPEWRLEVVLDRTVLLVRRFDRQGEVRVPFLSAMSMLSASDRETRSYLEIAEALQQHGARTRTDLCHLWRRIIFTVLISNTDDHLRNHGFLYLGEQGWALSPAYDLNPVPGHVNDRLLSTAIGMDDDRSASLDLALEVAPDFGLKAAEARQIVHEVADVVAGWRKAAEHLGLPATEIDGMESAFQHRDLEQAQTF
ncbi:type II toxin-antitoxin system HipA family toxin [Longimicrobium sp.]|uniref:type II toxin-antitoxin system HipA family toxin n=1 Tax=Longimicrobium sp. TaxID=2029185 RepID=UPI003B3A222B